MSSCGSASPSIVVRSDLPRAEPLHAEGELRHADAERDARAAGAEAVQRLQENVDDRRRLDRAGRPAARVVPHRFDHVVDLRVEGDGGAQLGGELPASEDRIDRDDRRRRRAPAPP